MFKIFFDTEFTGLSQNTSLISMAFIAETGQEFYAEFNDFRRDEINDWILNNVLSNLFLNEENQSLNLEKMYLKGNRDEIKSAFHIWLHQFGIQKDEKGNIIPHIQMWADVPHYDWVLFCQLFGGALNIPKQIHYMSMDLATFLFAKGVDYEKERTKLINKGDIPVELQQHNALYDAKVGLTVLKKYLQNEK